MAFKHPGFGDAKPIETRYDGRRFRSRTEARWARVFNELSWSYEYEPEGIEIGPWDRYLVDFWLPDFQIFWEVKPEPLSAEQERRAWAFVWRVQRLLVVSVGPPGGSQLRVFSPYGSEASARALASWQGKLLASTLFPRHHMYVHDDERGTISISEGEVSYPVMTIGVEPTRRPLNDVTARAIEAGLSARFEFGECG